MKWRILDGPHEQKTAVHDDLKRFVATIENVNDPAQRKLVEVEFMGTLFRTTTTLDPMIRDAIDTAGRTAVERFLDEQQPPARIVVSNTAITPVYE